MQGALWLLVGFGLLSGCSRDADPASSTTQGHSGVSSPAQAAASNPPVAHTAPASESAVVFETDAGDVRVSLEVVSTPARIQRGLMHRQHLPPDRGMLFVFGSDRVRSFWMKNTLISLDMLFVTSDLKVAGVERNTVPLTLDSHSIGIPTRYVIEVNGGWTEKHGVAAGTQLRFENLPEIHNPPL